MLIGSKCERVKRKVGSISIEVGVAKSMDANKCKVQPSRSRTRLVSAERAPSEHARVAVVPCRRHRRPTSTRISTDPASRPLGEPRRDVHAPCKRPHTRDTENLISSRALATFGYFLDTATRFWGSRRNFSRLSKHLWSARLQISALNSLNNALLRWRTCPASRFPLPSCSGTARCLERTSEQNLLQCNTTFRDLADPAACCTCLSRATHARKTRNQKGQRRM